MKREFSGEREGKDIVRWLNQAGNEQRTVRVANMILALQQFAKESIFAMRPERDWSTAEYHDLGKLRSTINLMLSRYRARPVQVGIGIQSPDALAFQWVASAKDSATKLEWTALNQILRLAEQGLLSRLRRCGLTACGKWYYARFDHQRFCGAPARCKEKHKTQSEDFKAKRRKYMRDYYRDNLSSTTGVKHGTRKKR
jgi:hypothetical protein